MVRCGRRWRAHSEGSTCACAHSCCQEEKRPAPEAQISPPRAGGFPSTGDGSRSATPHEGCVSSSGTLGDGSCSAPLPPSPRRARVEQLARQSECFDSSRKISLKIAKILVFTLGGTGLEVKFLWQLQIYRVLKWQERAADRAQYSWIGTLIA
jgi:hypothetical protein